MEREAPSRSRAAVGRRDGHRSARRHRRHRVHRPRPRPLGPPRRRARRRRRRLVARARRRRRAAELGAERAFASGRGAGRRRRRRRRPHLHAQPPPPAARRSPRSRPASTSSARSRWRSTRPAPPSWSQRAAPRGPSRPSRSSTATTRRSARPARGSRAGELGDRAPAPRRLPAGLAARRRRRQLAGRRRPRRPVARLRRHRLALVRPGRVRLRPADRRAERPHAPSPTRARQRRGARSFARGAGGERARAVETEDIAVVHVRDRRRRARLDRHLSQVSAGRKNRLWFEVDGTEAAVAFDQEQPETLWVGRRAGVERSCRATPATLAPEAARLRDAARRATRRATRTASTPSSPTTYAAIARRGAADGLPGASPTACAPSASPRPCSSRPRAGRGSDVGVAEVA